MAIIAVLAVVSAGACRADPPHPGTDGSLVHDLEVMDIVGEALHEFNQVLAVRELSGDQALILDTPGQMNRDERLLVVELATGRIGGVGHHGAGPLEYRTPRRLTPLGGDTTIVSDTELGRWLVVERERIVGSVDAGSAVLQGLGHELSGGARGGAVLTRKGVGFTRVGRATSLLVSADSLLLLIGNVSHERIDTVAKVQGAGAPLHAFHIVRSDVPWNPMQVMPNPLLVSDQALMFPDSAVAIVRRNPFRVEWRSPDGRWTLGPELREPPVRLTEVERREALESQFPLTDMRATPTSVYPDWPEYLPPFHEHALFAFPTGELVVRRLSKAGEGRVEHDLIDRGGERIGRFSLPSSERLVGIGSRFIYVATLDADGTEVLKWRPLPRL